ncbi:MAG: hypothetical protein L0H55_07775 [Candidatus Nitrosocosmicus sp.]|nr:hypothetical protein [Candidatus Nitrosocosmicus sp.]
MYITTTLLAVSIGMLLLPSSDSVFAQKLLPSPLKNLTSENINLTNYDVLMNYQNDNGSMQMEHEKIMGSINIMKTMYQAIESKINTTLTQAITTAEQSVGNGSYAMSATGEMKDGFLVYSVILGSPDMKIHKVLIDPGNGQVLQTKQLSMMEWMMMMHPKGSYDMNNMKMMSMYEGGGYYKDKGDYKSGW